MKSPKIGLVGCGRRLTEVMQQILKADDRIEITAIFDPSDKSVEETCRTLDREIKRYGSYEEVVNLPELDWIMIGSWNCFHKEQAIAAFRAGKNVFCEKPLATNLVDCLAMREAWIESGKLFSIGFTLRYTPHYRKIHEIVSSGRLGKIISLEFNETLNFNHGGYIHSDWRRKTEWAGTHLLEKCCHDIDMINWILQSRASRVASFGGTNFFIPENEKLVDKLGADKNGKKAFSTWHSRDHAVSPFTDDKDIVDNQVAILEYENGVRATFHTNCCTAFPERRLLICGSQATLRADMAELKIEVCDIGFDKHPEVVSADTNDSGHGGGDELLGSSVADTIINGVPPLADLEDGFASALTCFAVDHAMRTRQVIDLAQFATKGQSDKHYSLSE